MTETQLNTKIARVRIQGIAKMSVQDRGDSLQTLLSRAEINDLSQTGALPTDIAANFIENFVGGYTLPLGVATNFLIDGEEVLVPMAIEESSVVAAASNGAKLARLGGGFSTFPAQPIATCQIYFESHDADVEETLQAHYSMFARQVDDCHPSLVKRGGGLQNFELRRLQTPGLFALHIHIDTREAMGANIVNTVAEKIGSVLPTLFDCDVGLKILTNLTIKRLTKVTCRVPQSGLNMAGFPGHIAVKRIVQAYEIAAQDPFRAATHNKGIMNGIDAVVIATGNDWRAVEAGCHAYASLSGSYKPMSRWYQSDSGDLCGEIIVPIAVGTVGGVTKLHPTAKSALKILGNPSSEQLACIIASVGLAQNLSALRALACEGIQKGHMALHEKNLNLMRLDAVSHGEETVVSPIR